MYTLPSVLTIHEYCPIQIHYLYYHANKAQFSPSNHEVCFFALLAFLTGLNSLLITSCPRGQVTKAVIHWGQYWGLIHVCWYTKPIDCIHMTLAWTNAQQSMWLLKETTSAKNKQRTTAKQFVYLAVISWIIMHSLLSEWSKSFTKNSLLPLVRELHMTCSTRKVPVYKKRKCLGISFLWNINHQQIHYLIVC